MATIEDPRADVGTFTVLRGDPFTLPFLREQVTDANGNVTGYTELSAYGSAVTAQAKVSSKASTSSAISFTVDISNLGGTVDATATTPRLTLSLTGTQTEAMTASSYQCDVQFTGGGVSPLTLYKFTLVMVGDITQP